MATRVFSTSPYLALLNDSANQPPIVFATMDPANKGAVMILSEGDLRCASNSASGRGIAFGNEGVTTGKWYWEGYSLTAVTAQGFGIGTVSSDKEDYLGKGAGEWGYFPTGAYWTAASSQGVGLTYTTGSILGFALDVAGNFSVYVNNALSFTVAHGLTGPIWPALSDASTGGLSDARMNFGQDSSFGGRVAAQGNTDSFGKGDYYYAPPVGYKTLGT